MIARINSDMQEMKADIKADLAGVKADLAGVKTDLAGVKTDLAGVKADLAEVKADLDEVKTGMVKLYIKVENFIEPQLKSLHEGYEQTYAMCLENNKKLDALAEQVVKQEVEIKVIKGGKTN